MKTIKIFFVMILSVILLGFSSCGGGVDVVESGTYEGTISEVNADEQEIYVEIPDDKTLELYFTDSTKLVRNSNTVDFSVLEKNQKVEVTLEKIGKKLNPLTVEIK